MNKALKSVLICVAAAPYLFFLYAWIVSESYRYKGTLLEHFFMATIAAVPMVLATIVAAYLWYLWNEYLRRVRERHEKLMRG